LEKRPKGVWGEVNEGLGGGDGGEIRSNPKKVFLGVMRQLTQTTCRQQKTTHVRQGAAAKKVGKTCVGLGLLSTERGVELGGPGHNEGRDATVERRPGSWEGGWNELNKSNPSDNREPLAEVAPGQEGEGRRPPH